MMEIYVSIIYRRPNFNVIVFISELTSLTGESAVIQKKLIVGDINISMLLSNDASRKRSSFLDEFGLQQQVSGPTHKSGVILEQFNESEDVEVSEPFVNFVTSSDHGVVHIELFKNTRI